MRTTSIACSALVLLLFLPLQTRADVADVPRLIQALGGDDAQQAAEKAMKALLISKIIPFRFGHALNNPLQIPGRRRYPYVLDSDDLR